MDICCVLLLHLLIDLLLLPPMRHTNQHLYAKRLTAESFCWPSLRNQQARLSAQMEKEIQVMKRHVRVKHLKMFRAKEKLRTIEGEQQQMRDSLRRTIQQRLDHSQQHLEQIMLAKQSRSTSRSRLRQTTLLRAEAIRHSHQEDAFRKSQQLSSEAEAFLTRRLSESRTPTASLNQSHSRLRDQHIRQQKQRHESVGVLEARKKVMPSVLRVTEGDIRRRQTRKSELQDSKEAHSLQEYIQKLQNIDAKRQFRSEKLADTVKVIEKARKAEEQRHASRKKAESNPHPTLPTNTHSATKEAIKNKHSFSEIYTKKLQEKLARKAAAQQVASHQRDILMAKEEQLRIRKRQSSLVKETLKETQNRLNFRFMQQYRS